MVIDYGDFSVLSESMLAVYGLQYIHILAVDRINNLRGRPLADVYFVLFFKF